MIYYLEYSPTTDITKGGGYLSDNEVIPNSFDAVISCAVFEHLFGKSDVDAILQLLNEHGILFLHTLICEEVPKDPDWFYLGAAHVTFWTNAAMTHIYNTYGYAGCAYNVDARMWLFFKDKEEYLRLQAKSLISAAEKLQVLMNS